MPIGHRLMYRFRILMLEIFMMFESGEQRIERVTLPLTIGRAETCGLRIASWRVAKSHAQIRGSAQALELEDMGSLMGTVVNGRRITVHQPLLPDDDILIGPCRLRVRLMASEHDALLETAAMPPPVRHAVDSPDITIDTRAGYAPVHRYGVPATRTPVPAVALLASEQGEYGASSAYRRHLHDRLLQALDLRRRDVAGMSDDTLRREAMSLLDRIAADDTEIPEDISRAQLCREVLDEAVGLGPLEPLLADESISEIMVNRYNEIYIERHGRLQRHHATFSSEQSVRWVIDRIVAKIGRRIDESAPMVDARLPDGSRVNAVIPPIALKGAGLTIRKFPQHQPLISDLIQGGSISDVMAEFLLACVRMRKNIVVSGGTGAGKTTLLNVLSNAIPVDERIVTIEDAAELRLAHDHWVALETRGANLEDRGRIDMRDLVRNALRMRPDRIVVGECRGIEAFDMLTAMNTGHEGALTTLHANSPRDALGRLETMVLMAGMDLPVGVIREHIAASIHIVVQQTRLSDGRRIVSSIAEIVGLESSCIQLQELFRYDICAGFCATGVLPHFLDDGRRSGGGYDMAMFTPADPAATTPMSAADITREPFA